MTSLDEFATKAKRIPPGPVGYLDTLPDDIQDQIRTSKAGHSAVVRWLAAEGYPDATQQMVTKWRIREGWVRG